MIDITFTETEVHMLLSCMGEMISRKKSLINQLESTSEYTLDVTPKSIKYHADILYDMETIFKKLQAKASWTLH